jgi:hypothetical protein
MKKHIYALLLALIGLSSISIAQFKFTLKNDTSNLNGKTITLYGDVSSQITASIYCVNKGKLTISTKIRRIQDTIVKGSSNTVCWGTCYPPDTNKVYVTPTPLSIPKGDTALLQGDYTPNGFAGTSVITYIVFNTSITTDTAWVTVRFIATPAGIAQISANAIHLSAPYPNPADGYVNFSYHTATAARLTIFNSLGQWVEQLPAVSSKEKISINVAGLTSGIYICRLEVEGTDPVFQRLIISH